MITVEHFMTQTWSAFNGAQPIRTPTDTTAVAK
jgi:hypothetical protein